MKDAPQAAVGVPDDGLERLDGTLLLAFDALLRERNITRAAKRLGIGQPAMSARLRRLRDLFGDPLFVAAATGRGVVPTERAMALTDPLSQVLDGLRRFISAERPFEPTETGRVFTVAMHDNPAMMLAPSVTGSLLSLAPAATVVLVLPDGQTLADDLEKGRVDLLVGSPELAQPQWIGRPLLTDGFLTAQRKGHPRGTGRLDLDAFSSLDHLIISAAGHGVSGVVDDRLALLGRRRRVAASAQSYGLAPFIVERTDLVCTLPERLLSRFAHSLDLFRTPLDLPPYDLRMFWHPRSQDDAGHRWLRDQVAAAAASLRV